MKKYLLGLLTGLIITGCICGVIAYTYNAKQIAYEPSDNTWNVSNVETALNDLNEKANRNLELVDVLISGKNQTSSAQTLTITKKLSKGSYYLFFARASRNGFSIGKEYNTTTFLSESSFSGCDNQTTLLYTKSGDWYETTDSRGAVQSNVIKCVLNQEKTLTYTYSSTDDINISIAIFK